jgi:hypothetical protein
MATSVLGNYIRLLSSKKLRTCEVEGIMRLLFRVAPARSSLTITGWVIREGNLPQAGIPGGG